MKGDFTRDTFDSKKHYQQVLIQQGRVQLDADWNEQTAISARRNETTACDIIGQCGGSEDNAAFGVVASLADLTTVPAAVAGWFTNLNGGKKEEIIEALANGDFLLTAGRYYIDGIQCELEEPVLFTKQPDLPGQKSLGAGSHLLYLDAWQHHLTALDDLGLIDSALGGVDTATRVKTVWQVRSLILPSGATSDACAADINEYRTETAPSKLQLKAFAVAQPKKDDPCQVPERAGYKGLENQLYRVEIHSVNADGTGEKWKWSRENGAIVSRLLTIEGKKLTVESLGHNVPSDFAKGQFVEIVDDTLELRGEAGDLIEIDDVDENARTIVLKKAPGGTYSGANLKVRRWEGFEGVNSGLVSLEGGIQIQLEDAKARCRSGDYWLIPARAATAGAPSGDIEWPRNLDLQGKPDNNNPIPEPPRGITHHYCRLGIVKIDNNGKLMEYTDCRCLYPALTALPRLFYVSGDGQEVMPAAPTPTLNSLYKLPSPLIVGVANGHCLTQQLRVRFERTIGNGKVSSGEQGPADKVETVVGRDGLAHCEFALDGLIKQGVWINPVQQVTAQLLNDWGQPTSMPIVFNANLSIASQVAYNPAKCSELKGIGNVQDALDALCALPRGGGGCAVFVGEKQSLDEVICELLDKKRTDICICMLPGDHTVKGLAKVNKCIEKLGERVGKVNIKITGCGPGTRIKLIAAIDLRKIASFILRDMRVTVDPDIKLSVGKSAITFTGCGDIEIKSCGIAGEVNGGSLVFAEKSSYFRLCDCTLLAKAKKDLATALVISDVKVDTRIEENTIDGIINLYGFGGEPMKASDVKKCSPNLMKRTIKNAGSDIHLLGNRLSRVFVDKKILNSEEVTEKQVFLRNAFITNNVFNLGENQFAGKDIIFTSNTFAIVESYAALVWADSAIYTGNHSPRKNVLFNISNNIEKAANLLDIKLP